MVNFREHLEDTLWICAWRQCNESMSHVSGGVTIFRLLGLGLGFGLGIGLGGLGLE
jgi:hypothetical protein